MRYAYAIQAETDPHVSMKNMPRESFGAGAGNYCTEGNATRAGTKAPIRIFTLGRFSIAIDERAVRSKGKARHRPLGLLQALIALGGRDVSASRLCECLWPDSEGDLGIRNLAITLHRLRTLLQNKAAVLSDNGKLSLNETVCWVDAWNFERLVNDGLRRLEEAVPGDGSEMHLRAAFGLYAGGFLARESEQSWMLGARLRLETKFERLVSALSVHFEHQKRFPDAIDICLRALELNPLNELLYRRLMSCYLQRGEFAGVLRTYLRCREALAKGLSAPVSSETERLRLEAMRAADQGVVQERMGMHRQGSVDSVEERSAKSALSPLK